MSQKNFISVSVFVHVQFNILNYLTSSGTSSSPQCSAVRSELQKMVTCNEESSGSIIFYSSTFKHSSIHRKNNSRCSYHKMPTAITPRIIVGQSCFYVLDHLRPHRYDITLQFTLSIENYYHLRMLTHRCMKFKT